MLIFFMYKVVCSFCLIVAWIALVPNDANIMFKLFVLFEVAWLLGSVFAWITLVPNDANIVNISFVSFGIVCSLCLEVAWIALVPNDVNVVNMLFVSFEDACLLCLVVAIILIASKPDHIDPVLRSLMSLHIRRLASLILTSYHPTGPYYLTPLVPFHSLYQFIPIPPKPCRYLLLASYRVILPIIIRNTAWFNSTDILANWPRSTICRVLIRLRPLILDPISALISVLMMPDWTLSGFVLKNY